MNEQEKKFVDSIKSKIKKYNIQIKPKNIMNYYTGKIVETQYNDGSNELVDAGIEWKLCNLSPLYFIMNYGWIEFPGVGIIPYDLYYFQREILKDTPNFKKLVFLKSRQAGISTLYSLYSFWRGNFHEGENIDVVSIKQKKAQAFTKKMYPTMDRLPEFLKTKVNKKNTFEIEWDNGSYMLSESASDKAGRGDSLSLLILDELAFYQSDRLTRGIVSAAQPTLTRTGGQQVLISTPNGTSGSGSYYYEQVEHLRLMGGETETEKLIEVDWYEIPDIKGIKPYKGYNKVLQEYINRDYYRNPEVKKEMKNYFAPVFEKWKQNDWLKKQHEDLGPVLFKQEIGHDFVVSGDQVFTDETLEAVKENIRDPQEENKLGKTRINGLYIWKHPIPKQRYIIGCLPPGEKVLTNSGLKNIEEVNFSDRLLDKEGRETSIVNKQIYENVEEPIYEIDIEGILRETKFTGEHPIMASKPKISRPIDKFTGKRPRKWDFNFEYTQVKNLEKGDWLIYPNVYRNKVLSNDEILKKWEVNAANRYDFNLDKNIVLEKDFWWFVGIWLAEGWVYNNNYSYTINTCHNLTEEYGYVSKIKNIFTKYGRKISITERQQASAIETVFNSIQLYKFLLNNFNKGAKNKNIPEWVKYLPENFKIELVRGYLNGDGSISIENNRKNYKTTFVSVSRKLLEDFQDILFSIGIVSHLSVLRRSGKHYFRNNVESNTLETYQLSFAHLESMKFMDKLDVDYDKKLKGKIRKSIGHNFLSEDLNYIYLRINNINTYQYKGIVYNFETESSNYLCNYLTTHNCDVSSGTGDDYSSIEVMNVESYEQVAEYKGQVATKTFGKLVKKLARYYNEAYTVIESNGIGEAVFNEVYYSENDPYNNVYRIKKTKNGITRMTGWETTVKSRQVMINNLIDWLTVDELFEQLKIYSKRLYNEMITFVWKNGKAEHADGSHDDSLIAFGLCLYFRNKAEQAGESFLITEDGDFIGTNDKKDLEDIRESDGFDFATSDDEDFEDSMGMSKEDYKWLIS